MLHHDLLDFTVISFSLFKTDSCIPAVFHLMFGAVGNLKAEDEL